MSRAAIYAGMIFAALALIGGLQAFAIEASSTEIAGGRGGNRFADLTFAEDGRVVEVQIHAGDTVDSIQLMYVLPDGRTQMSPRHGGSGGRPNTFRLDSDEYIMGISGRSGDTIDSLCIRTNKRSSPTYGGRGGDRDFRIDVPSGNQAVGFAGRAGDTIDAIGLTYSPFFSLSAGQTATAGGRGGSAFSDRGIPQGARIAEIRIQAGDLVDSIQVIYVLSDGRYQEGPRHGGRGGNRNSFILDADEYITGLSGRHGSAIDSLRIHTNKRTSPLYGGRGGDRDYRIDVPSGNQAVGFSGRAGDTIDSIGLNFGAIVSSPSRQFRRSRQRN